MRTNKKISCPCTTTHTKQHVAPPAVPPRARRQHVRCRRSPLRQSRFFARRRATAHAMSAAQETPPQVLKDYTKHSACVT